MLTIKENKENNKKISVDMVYTIYEAIAVALANITTNLQNIKFVSNPIDIMKYNIYTGEIPKNLIYSLAKEYGTDIDEKFIEYQIKKAFAYKFPNNRIGIRVRQSKYFATVQFDNSIRVAPDLLYYDAVHHQIMAFDYLGNIKGSIQRGQYFYILCGGRWTRCLFSLFRDDYGVYMKIDNDGRRYYLNQAIIPISNRWHIRI